MNNCEKENTLMSLQSRLAEVVTVVYMAIHVGIYGRIILGQLPGLADGVLLYSGATAFYIALLYYASARLGVRSSVWGFTLAAALVVNLVASSIYLMMSLDLFARPEAHNAAGVISGPIAQLYLWSLFIYSFMVEASRRWQRRDDGEGAAERIVGSGRFHDRWWSTLLTAVSVAVLPILVLLSEAGTIALDVSEVITSFVQSWDPLIYIFLFGAYLLLFRITRLLVLKFLAVIFAVTAGMGITELARSSPELIQHTGAAGTALWVFALLLPLVNYYCWLRATQEF